MDALGAGWAALWPDMESRVTHERGFDGWVTLLLDMDSDATHEVPARPVGLFIAELGSGTAPGGAGTGLRRTTGYEVGFGSSGPCPMRRSASVAGPFLCRIWRLRGPANAASVPARPYSYRIRPGASRIRISRAGTPPTTAFAGTSFVTTALVPITALSPTAQPRRMHAP